MQVHGAKFHTRIIIVLVVLRSRGSWAGGIVEDGIGGLLARRRRSGFSVFERPGARLAASITNHCCKIAILLYDSRARGRAEVILMVPISGTNSTAEET